jgi:polyisoprenoid-binding protein YceI
MKTALQFVLAGVAALALSTCGKKSAPLLAETSPGAPATEAPKVVVPKVQAEAALLPVGAYKLDPAHSSLLFKVSHLGFSDYTAQFATFTADMHFEPTNPINSTLSVTVDPASLRLSSPPAGFEDEIKGEKYLDTKGFPAITFKSTRVEMTGDDTAKVTGDLTLHGQTHSVALRVKFNGGYAGHAYEPHARVGFSATGQFKRSDYGISLGVPEPGSKFGVSDNVDVIIETEFTGPDLPPGQTPPAPKPS